MGAGLLLAGPVFSLRLRLLPWGSPVGWVGVSVPFPGQVVGGGGSCGQLAESRPRSCQAAYSNSGPQGPAGRQARVWGRREPGPGLGREGVEAVEGGCGWRAGLAGQLLTWEPCPTSPGGQGLNTPPRAPTASPTATGKLPGTAALCAWPGWVSAPFPAWGQRTLPGARESLCPWGRPWPGASLPALAGCPPPPRLPGSRPLACTVAPSLSSPTSPLRAGALKSVLL